MTRRYLNYIFTTSLISMICIDWRTLGLLIVQTNIATYWRFHFSKSVLCLCICVYECVCLYECYVSLCVFVLWIRACVFVYLYSETCVCLHIKLTASLPKHVSCRLMSCLHRPLRWISYTTLEPASLSTAGIIRQLWPEAHKSTTRLPYSSFPCMFELCFFYSRDVSHLKYHTYRVDIRLMKMATHGLLHAGWRHLV